ncbi:MAG: hypothetical protein HN509_18195 [Halobacteriovoraceae bacterium]|jgi:hypothetical protein|nr:hypothetical protein [Halobacteriovoraceae bacterium]MBT5094650.1 hypothetical protein [Halobacteriovoraceae bacterium]
MKFLIPILIFLTACSQTSLVAPDLEYLTTNEKGKPLEGVVVYNPLGLKQLVKQRRNQAISRIRKACDPYGWKIAKEETSTLKKRGGKKYKENSNLKMLAGSKIRFVNYQCRK